MTDLGWHARLKGVLKPWVPARALSFYQKFREPLRLPDRSEVILFADASTLPDYPLRRVFSLDAAIDETVCEKVTLIATVFNEAQTVTRWLDSLLAQRRLPDEIVITDGGSTDATLEILQRYAQDFPVPMRVLSAPGANISRGRNLAIAAAQHEIVACSDCGSLLDENWLHALTLPFALDAKIGVSAGYYEVLETNTLSRLARRFFGVNLAAIDPQKFLPSGRSLAFRKHLWAAAGGYPEWLTDAGEDTLFDLRLKAQPARWAFVPAARAAWYAPDTLKKLLRTYFRYSRGDGETGIAADLYWFKVVELVRLWPRRAVMLAIGVVMAGFWPWVAAVYFGLWLAWSWIRFWRENWRVAQELGVGLYPVTALLEVVGTVQALAFTKGVLARPQVQTREIAFYQARLNEILKQFPDSRGIIVYPPTHDWGFMFQRPHQLARAFARQGWLYIYCTANGRTDAVFSFREIEPRLYLAHVPAETFRALKNPVVYLGSAWNRAWLSNFDAPLVIYDHYDDLEVSGARREDHVALLHEAEIVVVTAQRLLDAVLPSRQDALLIPNGVDYGFIQAFRPLANALPPADLQPILDLGHPIVGYSGALAKWFDYDLLSQAAKRYPGFSFLLLGADYDGSLKRSKVLRLPNVFYLGMKNYSELFKYVWRFDVGIIPFLVNDITLATSPVKLFEYLACGKPVVVTNLPECRHYSNVFLASNSSQFVDLLIEAMQKKGDHTFFALLERMAQENTWEERVRQIIERLPTKL